MTMLLMRGGIIVQHGHTFTHERAKCKGTFYSAYASGTPYQPSSNSGKVLIWTWADQLGYFACV